MKQVILTIPDNKYEFFMELVRNLGFEKVEGDVGISEEHKKIVLERIKKSKSEKLIPWKDARKQLHFKGKQR